MTHLRNFGWLLFFFFINFCTSPFNSVSADYNCRNFLITSSPKSCTHCHHHHYGKSKSRQMMAVRVLELGNLALMLPSLPSTQIVVIQLKFFRFLTVDLVTASCWNFYNSHHSYSSLLAILLLLFFISL